MDGKPILSEEGKNIGKDIPGISSQAELDAYLEENNLHKKDFRKFLADEYHIEFFDDGMIKSEMGSAKLRDIKAADVLHKMGLIDKDKINPDDLVKVVIEHCEIREAKKQQLDLKKQGVHKLFKEILAELKSSGESGQPY